MTPVKVTAVSKTPVIMLKMKHEKLLSLLCADIEVGYEETLYITPEGNVFVELCVVIIEPRSGGAPRPFNLSYTTEDFTAGIYYL